MFNGTEVTASETIHGKGCPSIKNKEEHNHCIYPTDTNKYHRKPRPTPDSIRATPYSTGPRSS